MIELLPGPLIGAANDLNQRWVMDLGLPGPDAGKGGKHLLVPPFRNLFPKDISSAIRRRIAFSSFCVPFRPKGTMTPPMSG